MRRTYTVEGRVTSLKEYLLSDGRVSVTALKRIKYTGLFLNGERVTVRATVHPGDVVELVYPTDAASDIAPVDLPLHILYEDESVLAVSKPTAMPVHPSRGNSLPTLAGAVMHYFRGRPFVFRAINRLDCETSGIVLIAKTAEAAFRLSAAMKRGEFKKEYLAVVDGELEPREGVIDLPIGREREDENRRVVRADGKCAITEYKTLRAGEGTSLLLLRLHTGRTHQIRVHLSHLGHPLTDDFLYGREREGATYRLHAYRLTFPHPESGERVSVTAPCPFLEEGFSADEIL